MPLHGQLRKIGTTKGPPAGYFRQAAFLYAFHSGAGVISAVFAGRRKLSPSAAGPWHVPLASDFGNMAGLKFSQAYSMPDGKFRQHAWRACWQCGGGTLEGDLILQKPMAKNDMDLLSMLLPHRQRNFAGHPDKCPAEALPRNKALQDEGMLGSSRRCHDCTREG